MVVEPSRWEWKWMLGHWTCDEIKLIFMLIHCERIICQSLYKFHKKIPSTHTRCETPYVLQGMRTTGAIPFCMGKCCMLKILFCGKYFGEIALLFSIKIRPISSIKLAILTLRHQKSISSSCDLHSPLTATEKGSKLRFCRFFDFSSDII